MNSFFDKLNLRPQERRLVVVVGLICFVVANIWFVWPRFKDWKKVRAELEVARENQVRSRDEIAQAPKYVAKKRELEGEGSDVLLEDQALTFQSKVQIQALSSGVSFTTMTTSPQSGTNAFFQELTMTMPFTAQENQLVDFLFNLGASGSLIRVLSMNIAPHGDQIRLAGQMTLIASYQRNPKRIIPGVPIPGRAPNFDKSPAAKKAIPPPKK